MSQQITDDIDTREYRKFRGTADGDYAVAVTIVDAVQGTVNYDSAEFTIATGTNDYNVKSNQSAAFSRVSAANRIIVRTDHNIQVKLNSASDPVITVQTVDSPFDLSGVPVTNMFISNNSGSAANVKLILT